MENEEVETLKAILGEEVVSWNDGVVTIRISDDLQVRIIIPGQ